MTFGTVPAGGPRRCRGDDLLDRELRSRSLESRRGPRVAIGAGVPGVDSWDLHCSDLKQECLILKKIVKKAIFQVTFENKCTAQIPERLNKSIKCKLSTPATLELIR